MEQIKYFTVQEANSTLPLVKGIVKDILEIGQQLRELQEKIGEEVDKNKDAQKLVRRLNEHIIELRDIGCSYRDWNFSLGLVDFPAVIDKQEVLLCWRSDEKSLMYYHDIDAGYAGRKEIPKNMIDGQ